MSKLFITVLGTGNYFDCNYYLGEKSIRTPFIQEALIKLLYPEKDFKMKILLTDTAKEKNYSKLEAILSKENITPELVKIPEGKTQDELWEIFDKVSETIDKTADELCEDKSSLDITIDITHSLRNIPMQIVVAMNYLTLFNNINLENIYYGAFELGDTVIDSKIFEDRKIVQNLKNNKLLSLKVSEMDIDEKTKQDLLKSLRQDGVSLDILNELENANSIDDLSSETIATVTDKNIKFKYNKCTITNAPICNLNVYYELLNWTNAINSFIKCGDTTEINDIVSKKKRLIFGKNSQNTLETKDDMLLIEKTVKSLNNFSNCVNTCRGMYLDTTYKKGLRSNESNSIKYAAISLFNNLKSINENISIKPLKKLFKLIEIQILPFIDKTTLEIGLATIDWCLKYNLYQQGYTALDETLKTLICDKVLLDNENDYKNRESIANTILTCDRKKIEDIVFDKELSSEEIKFIIEKLEILKQNEDFFGFVKRIKSYRNDINHFGFMKTGAVKYDYLYSSLLDLRNNMQKYCEGDFPWLDEETSIEV